MDSAYNPLMQCRVIGLTYSWHDHRAEFLLDAHELPYMAGAIGLASILDPHVQVIECRNSHGLLLYWKDDTHHPDGPGWLALWKTGDERPEPLSPTNRPRPHGSPNNLWAG